MSAIEKAGAKYPKDANIKYTYGTSGFRMKHDLLDPVMFRMGLLAVLRSKSHSGKAIGLMITASHNPEQDNGVKLTEPLGEMLHFAWEGYATELANANTDALESKYNEVAKKEKIDASQSAKVIIARDTRSSGPRLVQALKDALEALDATVLDFGVMTTPQLHYVVRCVNTLGTADTYGAPTEEGYYSKLATAFRSIAEGKPKLTQMIVDCANGVGAPKLSRTLEVIGDKFLSLHLVNTDIQDTQKLNYQCGADFVKVDQKVPNGVTLDSPSVRCASLDGDADRVVFFYQDENKKFRLLDGDKISALAASCITELANDLNYPIQVGVVQTAYANGASTKYFEKIGVPVACTETGVKHLHHRAESFDVGVYFEANGHGTVLFSPKVYKLLKDTKTAELNPKQLDSFQCLNALVNLINQTVGDAISDLLMVEAILLRKGWTFQQWNSCYTDLPSRQSKIEVKDRLAFKTTNADRQLVEPAGLQGKIDAIVKNFTDGRAFVRPSGTEDVVRVYAEAATQTEADTLAKTLCQLVYDDAGGKGTRP